MGNLPLMKGTYRTHKGVYKLKNPDKYVGNPRRVFYRSGWEKRVCEWCDNNPDVLNWGSEIVKIPYRWKGKFRNYYIDFAIKLRVEKTIASLLVEVKPKSQMELSRKTVASKNRKRILLELKNYSQNAAKRRYAMMYASKVGMQYMVWTEIELKALGLL